MARKRQVEARRVVMNGLQYSAFKALSKAAKSINGIKCVRTVSIILRKVTGNNKPQADHLADFFRKNGILEVDDKLTQQERAVGRLYHLARIYRFNEVKVVLSPEKIRVSPTVKTAKPKKAPKPKKRAVPRRVKSKAMKSAVRDKARVGATITIGLAVGNEQLKALNAIRPFIVNKDGLVLPKQVIQRYRTVVDQAFDLVLAAHDLLTKAHIVHFEK